MSFWSKLKNYFSSKSEVEEETLVEETRVIECRSEIKVMSDDESPATEIYNDDVANNVLSAILLKAIKDREVKDYVNIRKFIDKYEPLPGIDFTANSNIDFPKTDEIQKLAKTWYMLSYKCTNPRITSLMEKLR